MPSAINSNTAYPLPSPTTPPLCKRCALHPSYTLVRQDALCADCFTKYITTKVFKRMGALRLSSGGPNSAPRKLLLPLSFGPSSATLLHILTEHIEGQVKRSGRAGYELKVVHVARDRVEEVEGTEKGFEAWKEMYSRHEFGVISSPSSAVHSSAAEMVRDTLVKHAVETSCAGILFADTTTSLAERVLSETARGRGAALAYQLADGAETFVPLPKSHQDNGAESPRLPVYYPLREILRKELPPFLDLVGLTPMIVEEQISKGKIASKNTIDGLMRAYFRGVEEGFPSIVANVVRTAGKLRPPPGAENWATCDGCAVPIDVEEEQEADGYSEDEKLCYACKQALRFGE